MLTEDERDEEDDGRVPRAAERRKVRSGRERVDVSSLGVMYCMDDEPVVGIVVFCVWMMMEIIVCVVVFYENKKVPPFHIIIVITSY